MEGGESCAGTVSEGVQGDQGTAICRRHEMFPRCPQRKVRVSPFHMLLLVQSLAEACI